MKRLIQIANHEDGFAHVWTLVILIVVAFLLLFLITVWGVYTKYELVKTDIKRSIVTCEVENLDKQYTSLIEAESYTDNVDYNNTAYTSSFYTSLEGNFSNISKQETSEGINYEVFAKSGVNAFSIQHLTLDVSVADMPLHDAKTKRLVYTVQCNFIIPVEAFGYKGNISLKMTVPATYQFTV